MTDKTNTPDTGITPEVGKRYVTRGGWITPPYNPNDMYPQGFIESLISEYVEPTVPTDTFRRDLIARVCVAMVGGLYAQPNVRSFDTLGLAKSAIRQADILIEAMEGEV